MSVTKQKPQTPVNVGYCGTSVHAQAQAQAQVNVGYRGATANERGANVTQARPLQALERKRGAGE